MASGAFLGERHQRARAGMALGQAIEELSVRWGEAALDTELYIVMYLYTILSIVLYTASILHGDFFDWSYLKS